MSWSSVNKNPVSHLSFAAIDFLKGCFTLCGKSINHSTAMATKEISNERTFYNIQRWDSQIPLNRYN